MKNIIILAVLLSCSFGYACPDVFGNYTCYSGAKLRIRQSEDKKKIKVGEQVLSFEEQSKKDLPLDPELIEWLKSQSEFSSVSLSGVIYASCTKNPLNFDSADTLEIVESHRATFFKPDKTTAVSEIFNRTVSYLPDEFGDIIKKVVIYNKGSKSDNIIETCLKD